MSTGARVSSGTGSKQDYQTPDYFLQAVQRRFGTIVLDLAAHRENKVHANYFAPPTFVEIWDPDKRPDPDAMIRSLVAKGALGSEAAIEVHLARKIGRKGRIHVPNRDPGCLAMDAFKQHWAFNISIIRPEDVETPLGWLNCEFNDVPRWAEKCLLESQRGANIALLTPLAITDWYTRYIAGRADVYHLASRISFDGRNTFPKDCMLSHFHRRATGKVCVWDWRKDRIIQEWSKA